MTWMSMNAKYTGPTDNFPPHIHQTAMLPSPAYIPILPSK